VQESFQGNRANASCKSHAELEGMEKLDIGDVIDLKNGQWFNNIFSN
jgi:hypothetical protein